MSEYSYRVILFHAPQRMIDKGNWQVAKQHLSKLKDEYPESSRASIAKAKLQRLKQEGRI